MGDVMAKKKRAGLPRVTVLAYSKRDLVAFVQAVENLRLLVDDLRAEVAALKAKRPPKPTPPTPPTAEGGIK